MMDEAALEILAGLEDGVALCGADNRVRWVNPALRAMLGLADDAPAPATLEALGLTALGEESLPASLRERQVFRLGERYAVISQVGLAAGRALLLRDCTAQVDEWRQLITFTSMLTHTLRAPLTVISGFSELLLRGLPGSLDNDQREFVELIRQRATDCTRLVSNVIVINDLDSGLLRTELVPVDVPQLFERAAASRRDSLAQKGQSLAVEVPADMLAALADNDYLRRVVDELLDNACRYTGEGQITLRARAFVEGVRVEVEDSGPGIKSDQRERAFMRMVSGIEAGRDIPYVQGAGLGLAICKELVERMGGRIWIEDAPGGGTRACLTLRYAG